MRSGSATEVPPNFWTTSVIGRRTLVLLRRTSTQQSAPTLQRVEELHLGRVQDGAQGPDVVAPHRQDAAVEVAALDDDRAEVPHHRVGLDHTAEDLEVEHDLDHSGTRAALAVGLPEEHAHGNAVELRQLSKA